MFITSSGDVTGVQSRDQNPFGSAQELDPEKWCGGCAPVGVFAELEERFLEDVCESG